MVGESAILVFPVRRTVLCGVWLCAKARAFLSLSLSTDLGESNGRYYKHAGPAAGLETEHTGAAASPYTSTHTGGPGPPGPAENATAGVVLNIRPRDHHDPQQTKTAQVGHRPMDPWSVAKSHQVALEGRRRRWRLHCVRSVDVPVTHDPSHQCGRRRRSVCRGAATFGAVQVDGRIG